MATAWAAETVVIAQAGGADPAMLAPPCPPGRCRQLTLDDDVCAAALGDVHTLVFTGHSRPPLFLGHPPEDLAALADCLQPEVVVLDTCYGFAAPLLDALAARGLTPLVVGTTDKLSVEGLRYDPAFFDPAPLPAQQRAQHVHPRYGERLLVWAPEPAALAAARDRVAGWGPDMLEANLQRVHPNLVKVPLAEAQPPGAPELIMLVPVAPDRFVR